MEWKRVKTTLIIIFLFVDIFLAYQIYTKNISTNSDTFDALNSILETRNINVLVDLKTINNVSKKSKLLITSEEGISEDILIRVDELSKESEYIGNNKNVIDLTKLMATFIRDTKAENIEIENIYLCYFYDSSQVGENVKYAEAEPSWVIEVENEKYIYNGYTGNFLKKTN